MVIGKVYTPTDLAFYNKGKQIPSLLSDNISATVMTVLFPAIANENNDAKMVKKISQKSIKVMAYVIFPLMIGCISIAKPLVIVLLTHKWSESIIFMQIICLASAISILGNTSLQIIKAVGRGDILMKLELYKKPIYLALLIIGVSISVLGVAITSVLYAICGMIINAYAVGKVIDYPITEQLKDIFPSALLSIIMGICIYPIGMLNLSYIVILIVQILFGFCIYIALSRIFNLSEYRFLKNFVLEKMKGMKKNEKI